MARAALCFGDIAGGHILRHFAAAMRRLLIAMKRRQVEPLVRFDEVACRSMAAGRQRDSVVQADGQVAEGGPGKTIRKKRRARFHVGLLGGQSTFFGDPAEFRRQLTPGFRPFTADAPRLAPSWATKR